MTDILDLLLPEDEPKKCDMCGNYTRIYAIGATEILCKPCIRKLAEQRRNELK